MIKSAAPVSDVDHLSSQIATLTARVEEMLREIEEHRGQLKRLIHAYGIDVEQHDRLHTIFAVWDPAKIGAHVRDVVMSAPVLTDPMPHMVIEPLLPPEAFRALLDAVPPEDFFEGKKHLDLRGVGLESTIMPAFSRLIWRSLRREVVTGVLAPLLAERFRPFAGDFLRLSLGDDFVEEALGMRLEPHGLRLMLRRPGWGLEPHLDPRDQFITTLLYLAGSDEPASYGTQLFRVLKPNFVAPYANTYYPEKDGVPCELAKTMPYRGNLCLSFLNLGGGAHGAGIPADAEPSDLRRIVFQFYIGPEREQLEALLDRLPVERQVAWKQRVKKKDSRPAADVVPLA
jgi:hypothetical protein